jgi:hypothetical protein
VPLALVVGVSWYYHQWQEARAAETRASSTSDHFSPARDVFYAALTAGRLDEAYAATTTDFKARVSRGQLAELGRNYVDYQNRRQQGHGPSGAGSSFGDDYLTECQYTEREKGKIVQVSMTIRRDRDSVFFREPPPLKVDDFKVEEKSAPGQEPGFSRPLHRGPSGKLGPGG